MKFRDLHYLKLGVTFTLVDQNDRLIPFTL